MRRTHKRRTLDNWRTWVDAVLCVVMCVLIASVFYGCVTGPMANEVRKLEWRGVIR